MNLLRHSWKLALLVSGVAYPFIVYWYWGRVPFSLFLLGALLLVVARFAAIGHASKIEATVAIVAILALLGLYVLAPELSAKAYPVFVSLSFAAVFGFSLLNPPTIVERIARRRDPHLSPEGVAYTRKVTQVWVAFLLINAGIAAALACWGSMGQWSFWTGIASYLCMGLLFAGERLVRARCLK